MLKALTQTRGREHQENYSLTMSDPFEEDFIRAIDSSPFRRLAYKTQVMTSPRNNQVRTRLSHSHEVIRSAMIIADNLGLNVPLCRAIAAGHDIGHAPYGHAGEEVLTEIIGTKFKHSCGSVIAARTMGGERNSLNLSYETLQGILNHSKSVGNEPLITDESLPQEYAAVMFADKITYTFSDVNDCIRYGLLDERNLPAAIRSLGKNQDERLFTTLEALVKESKEKGRVSFSGGKTFEMFDEVRDHLYHEVYLKMNHDVKKAILHQAHEFFSKEPRFEGIPPEQILWILTDSEASFLGQRMIEAGGIKYSDLVGMGFLELIGNLRENEIDLTQPGIEWGETREPQKII